MDNLNCFDYIDYRIFLDHFIKSKQIKNPSFSLRAFAKKIGISAGHISLVLSGKKKLSKKHSEIFKSALELQEEESNYFDLMVEYGNNDSNTKERLRKELRLVQVQKAFNESLVKAGVLTWRHLFLKESLTLSLSTEELYERFSGFLGVDFYKMLDLLNELVNLKQIEFRNGKYNNITDHIMVTDETVTEESRKLHHGLLDRSKEMIDKKGADERYSCSEFFTASKDDFDTIKKLTNTYLDEIGAILSQKEKSPDSDDLKLYAVSLHINKL